MATTTNYGWTTPDDTALVKDGASAIRTLGSSIDTTTKNLNPETTLGDIAYRSSSSNTNTRLAIGSSGQVLTVAAGVPSWATPTDQTPLTTKGDLFTFSTVDARLPVGTDTYTLVADSTEATGLKWVAPASGGKVLQVVAATYSTLASSSSSTYADTGLTATITPTLATSKVLVLVSQAGVSKNSTTTYVGLRLFRGATQIAQMEGQAGRTDDSAFNVVGSSISKLDTPATTSATTYKTTFNSGNNSTGVSVQQDSATSSIVLLEIGA